MFCQAFERQTNALKHILMESDFSIIRYLFKENSHHRLFFTDLTASQLHRDVPSVVETISRWHNFAVVPEMITTREDGDLLIT